MINVNEYEAKLLQGWQDVHNKAGLSLWIMLALKDGAKHMLPIREFIVAETHDVLTPDEKSVYRTLRRFEASELITFAKRPSQNGPDLKVYELTETGRRVLQTFLKRNIIGMLYTPTIRKLIEKG